MENMIFTQLSIPEIRSIFRQELKEYFEARNQSNANKLVETGEQLLTVEQASQFLSLSVPTIYSKVSRGELPVCKPAGSKRVYFSKEDLLKYIKKGRQQTNSEIEENACDHLIRKNKAIR